MESEEKKRLVKVGQKHAAFVLGSLSLWGASDYWAAESGLVLALGLALIPLRLPQLSLHLRQLCQQQPLALPHQSI